MKTRSKVGADKFIIFILIVTPVYAVDYVHSDIYNLSQNEVILNSSTFSGFYYNIDDNTGSEKLTLRLSNIDPDNASAIINDQPDANGNRGAVYTTTAQLKDFDFGAWGQYWKIRFFGEEYFASYDNEVTWSMKDASQSVPLLYDRSENTNLMANEQISKILLDSNDEQTIRSIEPLKLNEGYQLSVKTVDSNAKKAQIELIKDGKAIDNKIIKLSDETPNIGDETYYYRKNLGLTKDIVLIAVHFKHILGGNNESVVVVDGIFQISDKPTSLKPDQVERTSLTIKMDNKDNKITISKNRAIPLLQKLYIRTADQDVINAQNPLRYYIYINEPRTYKLRGSVANLSANESIWTHANFSGFYYDMDSNKGTEQITFRLSNINPASAILSSQADDNKNRGIIYTTYAQPKSFKFKPWGQYEVIGFLGDKYVAKYDNVVTASMIANNANMSYLFFTSTDSNLMTNEQISKVLLNEDKEQTITSADPLRLAEGYQLSIKSIDMKGDKAYLELSKNGEVVDSKVIQPSKLNADIGDQTYYYKADLGETKGITLIAIHFKNSFAGSDTNIVTVDGIFQMSDSPTSLKDDPYYAKMSFREVNPSALTIKMDNKGNQVTLSNNKDMQLMGDIYINTADQYGIDAQNPLRYYIYKYVDIAPANSTTTAVAPAANITNNITTPAEKNLTGAANTSAAVVGKSDSKTGFESISIIIFIIIFLIFIIASINHQLRKKK